MAKPNQKKKSSKVDMPSQDGYAHIGERLKAERESQKIELNDIADELMIRRFYLVAIEEGDFKTMPAQVYAVGFVRNYAMFLGLNPDPIVARFKYQAYGRKNKASPDLTFPDPMTTNIMPSNYVMIAGAGIAALILVIALIVFWPDAEQANVASIPDAPTPAPIVTASTNVDGGTPESTFDNTTQTSNDPFLTPEVSVQAGKDDMSINDASVDTGAGEEETIPVNAPGTDTQNSRVTIRINEPTWIEVTDANKAVVLSRILKAGQEYHVPNQPGMTLITGNAGGITVLVDGKEMPKLGAGGDVRRDISLNPEDLQNN